MEVLVVGAGAMGRWFADAVGAATAFADVDRDAAAAAAEATGGRVVPLDGDETFDAVCIAVPISAGEAAIAEHAPRTERALVDVTGVMTGPVAAMAEHAPDRERLSLHPMFAPENAPGNVAAVRDAAGPVTDAIVEDLAAAGNDLCETTPAEHDEAMETVQASAHAAVLAFALAAGDVPEGLTTPVYEDLAAIADQVTGNEPQVYAEIQSTFDGADAVAEAAARLADADGDAFEALYREASER
ncbi:prephenate dehydrogenase [Halostella sp. JP-L12]|uniref:prephenate dehydrogenase/arogenate dehydrogenase family protein n=1 Tax=Halostella TaxID=1843185 RepID=UPI000EF76EB2|nr:MULTISPECIES: prephenate dehydrogenase/arogenate dehydrogenase family protein [Halostella]NHN49572.1 prephenate dehydrogenase [Halostella sp. JP-L12]